MYTKGHTNWKKGRSGMLQKSSRAPRPGEYRKGHVFLKHDPCNLPVPDACAEEESVSLTSNMPREEPTRILSRKEPLPFQDVQSPVEQKYSLRSANLKSSSADLKIQGENKGADSMRLVDSKEMMKMMNETYKIHTEMSPTCENLEVEDYKQEKRGVCWTYHLRCINCQYNFRPYKLYKEVENNKPGPNPAAPNIALAAALQDAPIGNSKFQEIFARINCPPPTRTNMNKRSNMVGKETVILHRADMAKKIEEVKEVNRRRGDPENHVNITVDGRYNSQTIASRKKAGLNASQALSLAIETNTANKYIISAVYQNKLCWKGAWLRNKGFEVECPDHEDCTSNHPRAAPVSERTMGKDIGTELGLQNILVEYATTDGDGQAAMGLQESLQALQPLWKVTRLADHVHLGQTQFRTMNRAVFSDKMFKGDTKEERTQMQRNVSLDVKCRCSLVLEKLMDKYDKNIEKVGKDLPAVLDATVRCYDGDCSKCAESSLVCRGTETSNWWLSSKYLASYQISSLEMDRKDIILLTEIIKMKLSETAVKSMKLYNTTNKNEAVHRAISVNLPKNVNFSRNMEGRLFSGVHTNNNGPGTSALQKSEHLGIKLCDQSKAFLRKMDKEKIYKRRYESSPEVKRRRLQQSVKQLQEHKTYKDLHKKHPEYRKDQLEKIPAALQTHDRYCKKKLPYSP